MDLIVDKLKDLKKIIHMSLALGVVLGFILGIGKGLVFVGSNRYMELEMYSTALYYFRIITTSFTIEFLLVSLVVFLIMFLLYVILVYLLKDETRGKKYTYYIFTTVFLIGLFLIVGYYLNKSSWYPAFQSMKGLSLNAIFTLLFISLGFMVLKKLSVIPRFVEHVFPRIFSFKFATISIFFLLVLNGVYYYSNLRSERNGMNVLFITADTLRADHLGSYGYSRDTSPHIDRLAKEGILFSQAIAQWPKTTPSFASMLTSTYGYYNGITRTTRKKIDDYFLLLPEIMKNSNYTTVGIVTNGNLAEAYNFHQGFDEYIEVWQEHESERAEHVTEYALSWLRDNSHKGKFFMWLHYVDPHWPYNPPQPYDEMFVRDKYYNGSNKVPINTDQTYREVGGRSPEILRGRDELDYYIAQYDAEIKYMDENIGRVLDLVKDMGLSDNTIIIFTADHGEALGDHNLYFAHGRFAYDDCLRVPLIVKIPGLKSDVKIIDHPVELNNVMPTILDILNIPIHEEAQGTSLMPLMFGDNHSIPEHAFAEAGYQEDYQRVIRTKKWKLIYIPDKEDQKIMQGMPFELYDIENDPNELNNLINVEVKIADQLKKELFDWMESSDQLDGLVSQEEIVIDKQTEESLKTLGYIQ
ncbi:MAG TPA: sulfatase [Thermodesulfobacteriota bacterium]|nr:sulfatase [Thermodesulfobacteriota bacterium]